jgi:hypothetical protein
VKKALVAVAEACGLTKHLIPSMRRTFQDLARAATSSLYPAGHFLPTFRRAPISSRNRRSASERLTPSRRARRVSNFTCRGASRTATSAVLGSVVGRPRATIYV